MDNQSHPGGALRILVYAAWWLAALPAIAAPEGMYQKRDTFVETVLATRTCFAEYMAKPGNSQGKSDIIRGQEKLHHFDMDISGREKLVLTVRGIPQAKHGQAVWNDAVLTHKNGEKVLLSSLKPRSAKVGWSQFQLNKGAFGDPISLQGKVCDNALLAHADSEIVYDLNGEYVHFEAWAGIDDATGGQGAVRFGVNQEKSSPELLTHLGIDFPEESALCEAYLGDFERWFTTNSDHAVTEAEIQHLLETIRDAKSERARCKKLRKSKTTDHAAWLRLFLYVARTQKRFDAARDECRRSVNPDTLKQVIEDLAKKYPTQCPNTDAHLARLVKLAKKVPSLSKDLAKGDKDALERLDEYLAFRRQVMFDNPLLDFEDLVFIVRDFLPGIENQGNHMCDQYFGFHARKVGGLHVLEDAFGDQPRVRDVLQDSVCENGRFSGRKLVDGGFLSPDLSYDGESLLFAFTEAEATPYEWSERSTFHVFRVNLDGTELQQLTDGEWNDFDPAWMPNGRVVFISERRGGYGRCHGRPVPSYTLHSMFPDGSDIVRLSHHETNEWHPSINNDGMVLYTRWDYVDRGFNQAHHPWITSPDGRDPRAIQGNFKVKQEDNPVMEVDVRAIPNSHKYVATAAAHHGQAYGSLIMIDPHVEDDDKMAMLTPLTPETRFPEANIGGSQHQRYATAWPLDEDWYLCVYDPEGRAWRGTKNNYGIFLLHAPSGEKQLVYRDPDHSCLSPIPLKARPVPPVMPHKTLVGAPVLARTEADEHQARELTNAPGTVGLVDVYSSTLPFPEGTKITSLRIMEVLPKTTPAANEPRIGHGSQKSARAVLGTVPVEEDGSAYFTLPSGSSVFFQALDEQGMAVQSMRSATYVQPGERLMCVGCHEPQKRAAQAKGELALAFKRPPSIIEPDVGGANPLSFPALVQPVLDRNCVPCHSDNEDKAPDLRKGAFEENPHHWYTSYINLKDSAFFYTEESWDTPITVPGKFGARASKLYNMIQKGHHDVKLSGEDMHRITLWLECNSDFFGSYEHTLKQAKGEVVPISLH